MSNGRKPSALPKHWPHPSKADLDAQPKRIVYMGQEQHYHFCDNRIKTSKYEWWNFLPKFLMEEFQPRTKFANCYFLMIAALQTVPKITNTGGYPTTLIPLLGVLIIAAVLKTMEDLARHRADNKANSSVAEVLDLHTLEFKKVSWSEVKVGDFIRVKSRETIPADCICVQVAEPNEANPKGVCFVETKQLDGETNLKLRLVIPSLLGKVNLLLFFCYSIYQQLYIITMNILFSLLSSSQIYKLSQHSKRRSRWNTQII